MRTNAHSHARTTDCSHARSQRIMTSQSCISSSSGVPSPWVSPSASPPVLPYQKHMPHTFHSRSDALLPRGSREESCLSTAEGRRVEGGKKARGKLFRGLNARAIYKTSLCLSRSHTSASNCSPYLLLFYPFSALDISCWSLRQAFEK